MNDYDAMYKTGLCVKKKSKKRNKRLKETEVK